MDFQNNKEGNFVDISKYIFCQKRIDYCIIAGH